MLGDVRRKYIPVRRTFSAELVISPLKIAQLYYKVQSQLTIYDNVHESRLHLPFVTCEMKCAHHWIQTKGEVPVLYQPKTNKMNIYNSALKN